MHPRHFASSNTFYSETKKKAIEDARAAQSVVLRECADASREPPPYQLLELIGKGSFGRVYKAAGTRPGQLVAVKIISIEEGDTAVVEPGAADTLGDIIREVNTLKLLSNSGARNVNAVVDTLLVGQSVWMVTEYCAGGSVASLMRPTCGLAERWIIPILREVAEALYWVHRQGIIHRDIKCANVLVTEAGGVQLCDFGVSGIIQTKFDKRSTVTGTLHWMAPELFDSTVSYGIEVDIWAFGSMAYEIANGLPPNATARINIQQFGSHLKQYTPRLRGDKFSDQLKHLVASCLVENPAKRPPIEQVQKHPYIFNTEDEYPTVSLSKLVADYKLWENQGGSRQSLFSAGGAQGLAKEPSAYRQSGWDFGNFDESDQLTIQSPEKARKACHSNRSSLDTTSQVLPRRRRRQPPNIKELKAPLEKVFDPNTISNYEDYSRAWYGRIAFPPSPSKPPPPRGEPEQVVAAPARESLIDLDAALDGGLLSPSIDMETIRPAMRPLSTDFIHYVESDRRKTQEWTFPSMVPPSTTASAASTLTSSSASANLDIPRYPFSDYDDSSPSSDFHSNQAYQCAGSSAAPAFQPNRGSAMSLIDLDACLVDEGGDGAAHSSHARSPSSVPGSIAFDIELDTHSLATSMTTMNTTAAAAAAAAASASASSLYINDDFESVPSLTRQSSDLQSTPITPDERSDIPWETSSSGLGILANGNPNDVMSSSSSSLAPYPTPSPSSSPSSTSSSLASVSSSSLPPLPKAPSANVLQGIGSQEDLKNELQYMIWSLAEHLKCANDCLEAFDAQQAA